jgi:hypothetical protein
MQKETSMEWKLWHYLKWRSLRSYDRWLRERDRLEESKRFHASLLSSLDRLTVQLEQLTLWVQLLNSRNK